MILRECRKVIKVYRFRKMNSLNQFTNLLGFSGLPIPAADGSDQERPIYLRVCADAREALYHCASYSTLSLSSRLDDQVIG